MRLVMNKSTCGENINPNRSSNDNRAVGILLRVVTEAHIFVAWLQLLVDDETNVFW
jgi:hypothetical protein